MCIGIFKNKWKSFLPTAEYLSVVSGLTSVSKLHNFIKQFQWTGEKGDIWQTPEEFLKNEHLDCEDFMRFTCDVLVRIMGIEARGVIHSGYDFKRWGKWIWDLKCHAICTFPWQGKFAMFSNNQLYTGLSSVEDAGKITFKDGLKYQEIRDWQGKILSKKFKLFGVF